MAQGSAITVRSFDGSPADAQGLLAVERATFDESPYDAREVQGLLTGGGQQAWLATAGEEVVGFVVAFATQGLRGRLWEIDLLAVHPAWRGRGLAALLIRAAAVVGSSQAPRARAVVAEDNRASAAAFSGCGFQTSPASCHLFIYRLPTGGRPSPGVTGVRLWETSDPEQAAPWLALDRRGGVETGLAAGCDGPRPGVTLLLAEQEGRPAGYAELIDVQTLLYGGTWIESLLARSWRVREALVQGVVDRAQQAGLDEVGQMAAGGDWRQEQALRTAGFRSLGEFRWYWADLPLAE